jgi:CHAT domain-containing protein/predicted negative regulator of RcsB-dependent stress response
MANVCSKHRSVHKSRSLVVSLIFLLLACAVSVFFTTTPVGQSQQNLPNKSADNALTNGVPVPNTLWQDAETLRAEQRRESNQKAIERYLAAASLWRTAGDLQSAAKALNSAAEVYQVLGDLRNALNSFSDALDLSKKAKNEIAEGNALNGLAYAYFLKGDSKAAHEKSLSALDCGNRIRDQRIKAAALSNLGESVYASGDLATAQKYQQEAYELWKTIGDQKGQAISQVALGYYSANLSEPQTALAYLEQALNLAQQSGDVRAQVLALNAMGNVKAKLGRKQEALNAYAKAQPLAEQIGDRLFLASILAGTSSLYYWMGEVQRAIEYDEQAVTTFEEIGALWGAAEAKLDLGRANNSIGNYERAVGYLNDALELFRAMGMKRLEAQALREMGVVQASIGDYSKSLETFEQSIKLNRLGQDYRYEAYALNLMGKVYEKLNDKDRARQNYQRALEMSRTASDSAGESNSLFNLARIARDRGDLAGAEQQLESALTIGESIRTTVSSQDLRASYFATIRQIYELYIDVLMLRDKGNPHDGFAARAFAISERARARSLLESLQEGQANVREGVDASLLEKERSLSEALNVKADRHMKLLGAKNTAEAEKLKKEIDGLTAEFARVRDQIHSSSPRYAALISPEPLNLQEVQQRVIDKDSILLEYALGDDRSYVWVITRAGLSTYELPPRREIEESARRLYSQFISYQMIPGESVQQQAERQKTADSSTPVETAVLTKLVLGPLAGKLSDKRLVIISDGALQYIPFQALYDPDSDPELPRWLNGKHEIVNEPSASTLALLLHEAKQRSVASDSVAVLADPVFEVDDPRVRRASQDSTPESAESLTVKQALRDVGISADGVEIPRLIASSEEADSIINSAPWGTGLKAVGFEATRQRVLGKELAGYRVIHFATHGMINNEHPELSGIVLSLFDREGRSQDGFLRLHDIYNLHLPVDLVVLSACSSGLGKDVRGEGLIGLTRGFMYAGASGVVASLWKVDDQATAELMKRFYEAMFQSGLSPVAALREAQIELSQQKPWQSPYYWAGFVIQGRYDEHVGGTQVTYLTRKRIVMLVLLCAAVLITSFIIIRGRRRKII